MQRSARTARRGDSRLGILAFLGGTALVLAMLVAFARYPSLFQRGQPYHSIFNSVSGLNLGDEVRYGGLLVGSVTKMQLDPVDPTRILLTFNVRRGTPMRVDTHASITQVGLLGQPFLNLIPGSRTAAPLPPGGAVLSDANFTFQDAMVRLALFLDKADTVMRGSERFMANTPFQRIDRVLGRFDTLAQVATTGSSHAFAQLDTMSRSLTQLLARTERMLSLVDTALKGVRPDLAGSQREFVATMSEVRTTVRELRDVLQRGDRMENIVKNLAIATDNLARLSERLERDPSSVLKKKRTIDKPAGPPPHE